MRRFKFYLSMLAVSALLLTSCSKDDPTAPDPGPEEPQMATLSFTALLEDFNNSKAALTKQQEPNPENEGENAIPECSTEEPAFVLVGITDSEVNLIPGTNEEGFIQIPVVPGDEGDTSWITEEGENDELELLAGTYNIQYFAVTDADGNIIYIAPRENDDYGPAEYQNFVSDPLPSEDILLQNGVKKYVDVEVLCYDEHYVQEYGYLFFDFQEVDIVYLCLFGNVCNDEGKHFPAHFRFDVYNYSGLTANPKGDIPELLYSDENEIGTYENGDDYARPLCVALPDREGVTDMYYGELFLFDDEGNLIADPIRMGVFDENDVRDNALNYQVDTETGDSSSNYYHFREDCTGADDSNPCLFSDPVEYTNDFDGTDNKSFIDITGIDPNYDDTTSDPITNTSGSGTMQEEGTYGFFASPSAVHSNWIDLSGMGNNNMLIINGEDGITSTAPYLVISCPEVCPGADYFVTFNLINVLKTDNGGGNNNAELKVVVNGSELSGATIQVPYNNGNQTWEKIGLRLKANGNGEFHVRFENAQIAPNGNDFAFDNIVISNDPSVMTGLTQTIIQP